jgi:phosphoenolpyruvate-protein kinase (PTS system EI component)
MGLYRQAANVRGDEQVAHLYNPLHPAVLRLIQFATEAALRNRIGVSLCGEMAGDPRYTALLLGLGIRELSMSATNLPRVKERVRALKDDYSRAQLTPKLSAAIEADAPEPPIRGHS